jgi:hypothetical protein
MEVVKVTEENIYHIYDIIKSFVGCKDTKFNKTRTYLDLIFSKDKDKDIETAINILENGHSVGVGFKDIIFYTTSKIIAISFDDDCVINIYPLLGNLFNHEDYFKIRYDEHNLFIIFRDGRYSTIYKINKI